MRTPADLEPNTECSPGAAIFMEYNGLHHIAIVTSVSDTEYCIREANYKAGQETFRCISKDAEELRHNEEGQSCWYPN